MNEEKIQDELKKAGLRPDKAQSQHFLKQSSYIKALVEAGEIESEHHVLEIGPGTGVITERILDKNPSKLTIVEKDRKLSTYLEEKFSEKELEVLNQDILYYEIPETIDRCVSNVPFQITSEILEKLGKNQIQSSLILQKELAERITADPGDGSYSHLTIMTQYYFLPVKVQSIPSSAYTPEPKVDTSIVKLYPNKKRHGIENEELFFQLTKALFTHKRKKARNAFVDARNILEVTKDEAKELQDDIPHSEERVINLNINKLNEMLEYLRSISFFSK